MIAARTLVAAYTQRTMHRAAFAAVVARLEFASQLLNGVRLIRWKAAAKFREDNWSGFAWNHERQNPNQLDQGPTCWGKLKEGAGGIVMNLEIGKIITTNQQRDAIHIAVAPVICGPCSLHPGQHVGVVNPNGDIGISPNSIGVVDPFLKCSVDPGQKFWLFLYPQTVTNLRHEWTHPAFSAPDPAAPEATRKAKSEAWLRQFADLVGVSYDRVIKACESYLETGDIDSEFCLPFDTPDCVWSNAKEMWDHYEIVTGKKAEIDDRTMGVFRCAC